MAEALPVSALLIDRSAFAAMLSMGDSTFDRNRAAGRIGPRPIRMSGSLRWERREAEMWIANRNGDELYDAATWPGIWQQIQRNNRSKQPS